MYWTILSMKVQPRRVTPSKTWYTVTMKKVTWRTRLTFWRTGLKWWAGEVLSVYIWALLRFLFLHTLFFFELYFGSYLIGTTISWSLDHIFWSYLLIISLDHILSDRWSYLTDDLMFLYISSTCARRILWILLTCFRHVLHTAYARHSFPMLHISCLQHALLMTYACFPCCLHAYFTI